MRFIILVIAILLEACASKPPIPINNAQPTIIVEPIHTVRPALYTPLTKKEKNTLKSAKKELDKAKQLIDNAKANIVKDKKKKNEYNPKGSLP